MPAGPRVVLRASALVVLSIAATAAPAAAGDPTGGAAAPARPELREMRCETGQVNVCSAGRQLRVKGEGLDAADRVAFLGAKGTADDRRAKARTSTAHRLTVVVPAGARSGPVRVESRRGGKSAANLQLKVDAPAVTAAPTAPEGSFPIQGKHDYGTEINRFGGARGHKGQDIFATCGTRLVAARSGEVTFAKFQARAGNYVVITADDGTSQAYMHMLKPALVERGERIAAGAPIGQVGETGRASGCHLHFESWTAPGWYMGGKPVDPLAELKAWDAAASR